jgi:hypothetical protein
MNSSKRGKSKTAADPEPQKKIKATQSKDSIKSQPKIDKVADKSLDKSKSDKK